jgi:hypothetical protein
LAEFHYDVRFADGRCIDLYDGCDDVEDFVFRTEAQATRPGLEADGRGGRASPSELARCHVLRDHWSPTVILCLEASRGYGLLPKEFWTQVSERWVEHRPLAYILARIIIVFLISYSFFGVGGLRGLTSGAALIVVGVALSLRARRW